MNIKLSHTLLVGTCLIALNVLAFAQAKPVVAKPTVFSTAPKLAIGKINDAEEVRGQLTYTVTAANSDDTVAGTVNFAIPDAARQRIAQITGKPLPQVPSTVTKKDVVAQFQKGTEPPVIHLEITGLELDVVGAKTKFNRIVLDINARQGEDSKYTKEEMEALFTIWARQISTGRSRRGIIARMNRAINGEEEQQ
jgi:hypothetical protein